MSYKKHQNKPNSTKVVLIALAISLVINLLVLFIISTVYLVEDPKKEKPHTVELRSPEKEAVKEPEKNKQPTPKQEIQKPQPQKQPKQVAKKITKPTKAKPVKPKVEPAEPQVATKPTPAEPMEEVLPPKPSPSVTEPEPEPKSEPLKTTMSYGMLERAFGETAEAEYAAYAANSQQKRRNTLKFGSMSGKVKRALSRNKSWVAHGVQRPLASQKKRLFYNYLEASHDKIHSLFADSFLASLNSLDSSDPLNNFSMMTKLEFEILHNGQVNEVRVIRTSGNTVFDAAAVDSIYRSSPFPPPPPTILSWNNRVYFRWGFYRNMRKCGVFNAEPYLLEAPGSTPKAIDANQFKIIDG